MARTSSTRWVSNLVATARLRHVADLGIRAMRYSYAINDLPPPTDTITSRAHCAGRERLELGFGGRRRPCHGGRLGFLSRGDATEAPRRYWPGRDRSDCAAVDRASRRHSPVQPDQGGNRSVPALPRPGASARQRGGERFRVTMPNDQGGAMTMLDTREGSLDDELLISADSHVAITHDQVRAHLASSFHH